MELIADGLLILAALVASVYCLVLSRRLRRLNRLDNGLGGAIASLSLQVDEMRNALSEAKQATERSKRELDARTKRAEKAAGRLELLLAAVRTNGSGTGPGLDRDMPEEDAEADEIPAPAPEPEPAPAGGTAASARLDDEGPAAADDMAEALEEAGAAEEVADELEDELRLADALADPDQLKRGEGGISTDLLAALSKVSGGAK
ncbi:MAG: hypothetical protein AAGI13_04945 [Pseudomonadota bacterium]